LVTAVTNIAILVAVAVSATVIFGLTVHAVNNMVEDMRFKKTVLQFTAMQNEDIDEKIKEYKSLSTTTFAEDVRFLVDCSDEIIALFNIPSAFENGLKLKSRLQFLMELYYIDALYIKNQEYTDLLLEFFYSLYNTLDSVVLQEALIKDISSAFIKNESMSDRQSEILNFHFDLNDRIFNSEYKDSDRLHRVGNQSKIVRWLLRAIADDSAAEKLIFNKFMNTKKYGTASKQIFLDEYIRTLHKVPAKYLSSTLNKPDVLNNIKNSHRTNSTFSNILKDMHWRGVPVQIGSLYTKANNELTQICEILFDNKQPIEYRLYALATISKMQIASDSLKAHITFDINSNEDFYDSPDYGKQLIDNELSASLAEKSRTFLDNLAKRKKIDSGNDFLNAVETEMAFAAFALIARNDDENIDPVYLLKRIAFVFGKKLNVEVAIKHIGNNIEIFNVPLKSGREFVSTIEKIAAKQYE